MGFRSLAIEKRSSEVWQLLGAVQTEFGKYNNVVEKLGKNLATAARSVHELKRRTRVMGNTLRNVESLDNRAGSQNLLGLPGAEISLEEDEEEVIAAE